MKRFSSRRSPLDNFLPQQLEGAVAYDRIAGYFSSSVLELAGEALEAVQGEVRVVCNSQLDPLDVVTARAARLAMRREWGEAVPEEIGPPLQGRLARLHQFLTSGKLHVKVLPDQRFGLIHGKAGVVTRGDGSRCCFLGSANESRSAWTNNYELVWCDDSPEGVAWVQEEFDALWHDPAAVDLADAVVEEIGRLARRTVTVSIGDWVDKEGAEPAAPVVELPLYRRENGLWAHQKTFVKLAFEAHQRGGARFVLADQVGLGKTVQLGLAAKLMALYGDRPILILAPKPLMLQWQDELWSLLQFPTARWNGRQWIDEGGIVHPDTGPEGLTRCPRRAGIVSTGLVKRRSDGIDALASLQFECVILDEAHHARRTNLGPNHAGEDPQPTHLLKFMKRIARRTKSLLLATATPVQIDPIEAWDLLDILAEGNDQVLGDHFSSWRRKPQAGLDLALGRAGAPEELTDFWEWIRDPLPPARESIDFEIMRRNLGLSERDGVVPGGRFGDLRASDRNRLRNLQATFFRDHHPYIRHIVRRTREFLETTLDPETDEPYLQPVKVRLHGESDDEAIALPAFLERAYGFAEEFCRELAKRPGLSSGFLKTMLLRRVGSTIEAGRLTARKMLGFEADDEDAEDSDDSDHVSALYPLEPKERAALQAFADALEANQDDDPKLYEVIRKLESGWLEPGCILFSQYYDSVLWLAGRLSERMPEERIGVYAGAAKSGTFLNRAFTPISRDEIKRQVQAGAIRLLVGTDAASEGLNLQRLGTLINLDLPWNPTRLEQRKGRIQRIGQIRDTVDIYNMRYRGSVEDRVHQILSLRLENIRELFGQVPDTLEDVWVDMALADEEQARRLIDAVPTSHPFEMRYNRVEYVNWESCARVLAIDCQLEKLRARW